MKLSAVEAREALLFCVRREGKKCFRCKRVPVAKVKDPSKEVWRLVNHHVDDNNENNPLDGSNWKAACDSCNLIMRKPYKHQDKSKLAERWKMVLLNNTKRRSIRRVPAQMLRSEKADPFFRSYIEEVIERYTEIEEDTLVDAAANEFFNKEKETISQQTLLTYLDRLCNPINGGYEKFKKGEEWWVRRRLG